MLSLWASFYLGHEFGFTLGSGAQWWQFPFLVTSIIACFAEFAGYAVAAARWTDF